MSRSSEERINDILESAALYEEIVSSGRESFLADEIKQAAAERFLEKIGQAAKHLSSNPDMATRFSDIDWRDPSRQRDLIIHYYHRVDPQLIWESISESVPELAKRLST